MRVMWEAVTGAPPDLRRVVTIGEAVLAASPSGVFASTDLGASWRTVLQGASALAAGEGAVYAADGRGVWHSIDAGATWTTLPALPVPDDAASPVIATASALGVAPDGTVWVGLDCSWLSFYPVDLGDSMPMMHSAGRRHGAVYRAPPGDAWSCARGNCYAAGFAFRGDEVWVAGSDGVHRVEGTRCELALDRPAGCVAIDTRGRVVIGTNAAAYLAAGGAGFEAIGVMYKESGDWGSVTNTIGGFSALVRAPDGQVWGAARGQGTAGVVRLDDGKKRRWLGRNHGLLWALGGGLRSGLAVLDLTFTSAGVAFAATERHGLFRAVDALR